MVTWTKKEKSDHRQKSTEYLRATLKPGDEICCILRHVSASGMSRHISFVINRPDGVENITWDVCWASGETPKEYRGNRTMLVGGCGMDMGFNAVYNLGRYLFPDGFIPADAGRSSGRNGSSPNILDPDGGYALRHRWL